MSAFSLVELVMALAILSVGLVGGMRVFPMGLRASQRAELASRAVFAAHRTLEALKLNAWEELREEETTVEEDGLRVTTRIRQPSVEHLADPTRLKAVEVTVRSTQAAPSRELVFVTYVRRD